MAGSSSPVVFMARSELRRRWRAVIVLAILFGLAGGAGLGLLAGARRTASVFERHLQATDASQIEIDPGQVTPEVDRTLRTLPGVTGASYWVTYSALPLGPDGSANQKLLDAIVFTTDGRYLEPDRVVTTSGRLLDPSRRDEVMVNQSFVDATGLTVGSKLKLGVTETDDNGLPLTDAAPSVRFDVTVVGVMVLNEEITSESIDTTPRLFVSPAARTRPIGDPRYYGFSWYGLKVAGGPTATKRVAQRWQELADAHNAGLKGGDRSKAWLSYFHYAADLQTKASRASRPLVTTLAAFGLLVLLAAMTLVAQTLSREVRGRRSEAAVTRVLGLTPGQAMSVSMAVPIAALTIAVVVALGTALLVSMAFPVGPFAVLDPGADIDLDLAILLPGAAVLLLGPLVPVTLAAWREARVATLARDDSGSSSGRATALLRGTGRFPALDAAMRLTLEPGRGGRFVPTRSMLLSIVVTIVALVTVVVFGSNLRALDRDPARFGWHADAIVASDGGYGPFDKAKVAQVLDRSPDVAKWRYVGTGRTFLGGELVPSVLFGPGDPAFEPTQLTGRPPARRGEVVLGTTTMKRLGTGVGKRIAVGSGVDLTEALVTGTAVFPVLGPVLAARTGLDEGAWFDEGDYQLLDAISGFISYGLPNEAQFSNVLVKLKPGSTLADIKAQMADHPDATLGSSIDVYGVVRPSEVQTAAAGGERVQILLGSVLAVVAAISTLLALAAVVRRRRSELAIYRVLGFRPRQVRATLLGQGLIMSSVGVLVGLPLGVGIGRTLWRLFATRLGVVPDPIVPFTLLGLVAVVAVLLGLVGALGPALVGSRVPPALGVRTE